MAKKKSNFRKGFRRNKRIKHPTYVIDEKGNVYRYIGITHSDKTDNIKNVPLKKNPNSQDSRKAYLRPFVEEDEPKNFGRSYKKWSFSSEDKETVRSIINKNKKNP